MLLHSQHCFCCHNSCRSLLPLNLQRLPAIVFGFRTCSHYRWGVLHRTYHCMCHYRCEYCFDYIFAGITEIVLRWSSLWSKPRSHRRYHVPPKYSTTNLMRYMRLHVPTAFFTRLHALTAFFMRLHALAHARFAPADISPRWRYLLTSLSTIYWRHPPR